MKVRDGAPSRSRAAIKSIVLTGLLAAALASCSKSIDRPSPQSPPKPKASSWIAESDIQKAVFTSRSRSPAIHYQNGLGKEIPRLVIRT